jgi:uncharacterized membrane protein
MLGLIYAVVSGDKPLFVLLLSVVGFLFLLLLFVKLTKIKDIIYIKLAELKELD